MSRRPLIETAQGTRREAFGPQEWALLAAIAAMWGSSFLFIEIGLEHFGPGVIAFGRVAVGALTLSLLRGSHRPVDRSDLPRVALLGVVWMAAPLLLFPIGQQWIDSSLAGMLNGAVPIFAAVTAAILLRRLPASRLVVGIAVGFVGVAFVSLPSLDDGGSEALGVILVIVATACYGFSVNIAAPLQQRYGSLNLMANVLILATIWTLPYGLWGLGDSHFELGPIAAVLFLGVVGTGLAFVIMGTLVGRVGATRASMITYIIPVVALVLGVVFRDDVVAPLALVGVVFVIGGAFLASRSTAR